MAVDQIQSREEHIQKTLLWESEASRMVLFSSLPGDVTEDSLVDLVKDAGEVEGVVIMPHYLGLSDVALLLMESVEQAQAVRTVFHMRKYNGRRLQVGPVSMRDHQLLLAHFIKAVGLDEVADRAEVQQRVERTRKALGARNAAAASAKPPAGGTILQAAEMAKSKAQVDATPQPKSSAPPVEEGSEYEEEDPYARRVQTHTSAEPAEVETAGRTFVPYRPASSTPQPRRSDLEERNNNNSQAWWSTPGNAPRPKATVHPPHGGSGGAVTPSWNQRQGQYPARAAAASKPAPAPKWSSAERWEDQYEENWD